MALSSAERVARYRARRAGELYAEPKLKPGPRKTFGGATLEELIREVSARLASPDILPEVSRLFDLGVISSYGQAEFSREVVHIEIEPFAED
jgi:hypothetical protein